MIFLILRGLIQKRIAKNTLTKLQARRLNRAERINAMRDLNKYADRILNLYDNRSDLPGDMAKDVFVMIRKLIVESKELALEEKAALEMFNVECYEAQHT